MKQTCDFLRTAAALGVLVLSLAACAEEVTPPEEPVSSIEISPEVAQVEVGGPQPTQQFTATLRDADRNALPDRQVTWASLDSAARVDNSGLVTAERTRFGFTLDTVRVTATVDGVADTAMVIVYPTIAAVHSDLPGRILVGKQRPVTASLKVEAHGGGVHPSQSTAWSSSDTSVVAVSPEGILRAKRTGTATVTATAVGRTTSRVVSVVQSGYKVTDLGTLGGDRTVPAQINDQGQVVGQSTTAGGERHAFLWQNGRITDLGTLRDQSIAWDIDPNGVIVGGTTRPDHPAAFHPTRWTDGQLTLFAGTSHGGCVGRAINTAGQIAVDCQGNGSFIWQNGQLVPLAGSGPMSEVHDINLHGEAAGTRFTGTGQAAVLWRNGAPVSLASSRTTAITTAINNRSQAIGFYDVHGHGTHGFLWSEGNRLDLGNLGSTRTMPRDLNESTVVVGSSQTPAYEARAFLWRDGIMSTLNDLVRSDEWMITDAVAINGAGQIVGIARHAQTGRERGVLLTPE